MRRYAAVQLRAHGALRYPRRRPGGHGLFPLMPDWLGHATPGPGFEQLLRTTDAGNAWADVVGAVLQGQLTAGSLLDLQPTVADAVVYRAPHLSAVVGHGAGVAPVRLR